MNDQQFLRNVAGTIRAGGTFAAGDAEHLDEIALSFGALRSTKPFDPVARPAHYARGSMEHIDTFESRAVVDRGLPPGTERFLGGMEHNLTKYIWRAGEKVEPGLTPVQQVLKDWSKALWYVNRGVEHLKRLTPAEAAVEITLRSTSKKD